MNPVVTQLRGAKPAPCSLRMWLQLPGDCLRVTVQPYLLGFSGLNQTFPRLISSKATPT